MRQHNVFREEKNIYLKRDDSVVAVVGAVDNVEKRNYQQSALVFPIRPRWIACLFDIDSDVERC